jgi:Flp pilus assembly protein TadB
MDMMTQLFFFGVLFAFGLFLILADILKLPTLRTAKAMLNAGREDKKASKTVEAWLMSGAVRLSKLIRMDEYKRGRMANVLKAAGVGMTPEVYSAYAIVKAGAILLGVIPCLVLLPLLAPVLAVLAILTYFKEIRKADEQLREKREQIEGELPRFVATIEQTLKASRDVLAMIENYKRNAGPSFARELDIVTADMRSSSYEAALTRFEARLNSPMLSDVVRGLVGVLRGDDSSVYFQMLAHDFKALELQRLKGLAQKIPPKIRIFSFIMLLCFLFTYLVIIAMEILNSLGGMF